MTSSRAPRVVSTVVIAATLLATGVASADPPLPAAAPVRCDGVAAEVHGGTDDDIAAACHGTREAAEFLAAIGLAMAATLTVHIVDTLPADVRSDAVGCYVASTKCVYMLDSRRFLAKGKWFGIATSRALHRSVFAHEAAHAIVASHVAPGRLSIAATEYVAYVVMFATMDANLRQQALAAAPADGFTDEFGFNDIVYSFDPMRFGVEAYKHWRRQADGAAFLRRVLAGEVMPSILLF